MQQPERPPDSTSQKSPKSRAASGMRDPKTLSHENGTTKEDCMKAHLLNAFHLTPNQYKLLEDARQCGLDPRKVDRKDLSNLREHHLLRDGMRPHDNVQLTRVGFAVLEAVASA
jgi:hypothetical protein